MSEERPKPFEDVINCGRDIIFKPQIFFQEMTLAGGYLRPLFFASTVFLIVFTYNALLVITGLSFPNGQEVKGESPVDVLLRAPILYALWVVGLFGGAALLHLSFKLLNGKASFLGTFCIFAYSSVSNLLSVVPFLGQYLSPIYGIVLIMLGGRYMHGLSNPRAIIAALIPALMIWVVVFVLLYTGVLPLEKLKEGLRH